MKPEPIFAIGDKVKIVGYGSIGVDEVEGQMVVRDWQPQIVGKVGIVCEVNTIQASFQYAIKGIEGKIAWYNEDQLEMVNKNPNK